MIVGRHEEVLLAWLELQPPRFRTKRPETNANLDNVDANVIRNKPIEVITIQDTS